MNCTFSIVDDLGSPSPRSRPAPTRSRSRRRSCSSSSSRAVTGRRHRRTTSPAARAGCSSSSPARREPVDDARHRAATHYLSSRADASSRARPTTPVDLNQPSVAHASSRSRRRGTPVVRRAPTRRRRAREPSRPASPVSGAVQFRGTLGATLSAKGTPMLTTKGKPSRSSSPAATSSRSTTRTRPAASRTSGESSRTGPSSRRTPSRDQVRRHAFADDHAAQGRALDVLLRPRHGAQLPRRQLIWPAGPRTHLTVCPMSGSMEEGWETH